MGTKLDINAALEAVENDENKGFCVACGCEHDGIEPDARNYKCESCNLPKVFSAEQILIELSFLLEFLNLRK